MNKVAATVIITLTIVFAVALPIFFGATPVGKAMWNDWFHAVQKADDRTSYETKKQVEDTCRSMIASYNSDKRTYEQYKDSDNIEKLGWAEQAKMRANKTASTYNNYILQNSYVWRENVPADIFMSLGYLE